MAIPAGSPWRESSWDATGEPLVASFAISAHTKLGQRAGPRVDSQGSTSASGGETLEASPWAADAWFVDDDSGSECDAIPIERVPGSPMPKVLFDQADAWLDRDDSSEGRSSFSSFHSTTSNGVSCGAGAAHQPSWQEVEEEHAPDVMRTCEGRDAARMPSFDVDTVRQEGECGHPVARCSARSSSPSHDGLPVHDSPERRVPRIAVTSNPLPTPRGTGGAAFVMPLIKLDMASLAQAAQSFPSSGSASLPGGAATDRGPRTASDDVARVAVSMADIDSLVRTPLTTPRPLATPRLMTPRMTPRMTPLSTTPRGPQVGAVMTPRSLVTPRAGVGASPLDFTDDANGTSLPFVARMALAQGGSLSARGQRKERLPSLSERHDRHAMDDRQPAWQPAWQPPWQPAPHMDWQPPEAEGDREAQLYTSSGLLLALRALYTPRGPADDGGAGVDGGGRRPGVPVSAGAARAPEGGSWCGAPCELRLSPAGRAAADVPGYSCTIKL